MPLNSQPSSLSALYGLIRHGIENGGLEFCGCIGVRLSLHETPDTLTFSAEGLDCRRLERDACWIVSVTLEVDSELVWGGHDEV
jgi:hypothetical protein